jgi:hypothetical protein
MLRIADDDNVTVRGRRACGELLDAGYEGTCRVDDLCCLFLQVSLNVGRNPMRTNDCSFIAADLDRLADGCHALVREALHFLGVVDERTKAADGVALLNGVLDHLDGPLDAKAKPVFIR